MTKKEGVHVQDAEAGIHARVRGTGREAGEVQDDDWSGCTETGFQLGEGGRESQAQSAGGKGGYAGADGTVAPAGGELQAADGVRNPKKATAYFAKDVL
jgi:hypothetical protein